MQLLCERFEAALRRASFIARIFGIDWVASETWLMGTIEGMVMKGFALHGVIGAAVAIAPELADPPRTLRIQLKNMGRHGFVFERSNDPNTMAYPVYTHLRDASTIERRLVERCQ